MTPDINAFREYLACYGADIESWPDGARVAGQHMRHHPECAALLAAEQRFEHLLHARRCEEAQASLYARIMDEVRHRPAADGTAGKIFDMISNVGSAALAAMLILGFVIGVTALPSFSHSQQKEVSLQSYDDEGIAL